MSLNKSIPGTMIANELHRKQINYSNFLKAQKLRTILPDFPWRGIFQTFDEIENYFEGDNIQCLLCGRLFKSLGNHVRKTHGMSPREYKIMYGLPLNRGLSSHGFHNKLSKLQKKIYDDGRNPLVKKDVRLAGSFAAKNKKHQYQLQPFNKKRMSQTHLASPLKSRWVSKEKIKQIINETKNENNFIKYVVTKHGINRSLFYKMKKIYCL